MAAEKSGKARKKKKRRSGPLLRFRFGRVVLIWVFTFIIFFVVYMYNRNVHPEKDVFLKGEEPAAADESSALVPLVPAVTDATQQNPAPEQTQPPQESEAVPKKVNPVPESASAGEEYLQKAAFLGERNIHMLGESGLLGGLNVYASDTLTLDNYTSEYVTVTDPERGEQTTIKIVSAMNSASCPIYLCFGTESLAVRKADEAADQFSVLLGAVRAAAPETDIFILAIPPVTAAAENAKEGAILNETIDTYNSLLLNLANQTNVYFVDTNTALKNNEGKLDPALALEDGIHLNAEAGKIFLNYVLTHVPRQTAQ